MAAICFPHFTLFIIYFEKKAEQIFWVPIYCIIFVFAFFFICRCWRRRCDVNLFYACLSTCFVWWIEVSDYRMFATPYIHMLTWHLKLSATVLLFSLVDVVLLLLFFTFVCYVICQRVKKSLSNHRAKKKLFCLLFCTFFPSWCYLFRHTLYTDTHTKFYSFEICF